MTVLQRMFLMIHFANCTSGCTKHHLQVVPMGPVWNCLVCMFVLFIYLCYLHNACVFLSLHVSRYRKRIIKCKIALHSLRCKIKNIVKPKCIQTPSTFLTLSHFICYSLQNGNKIWQELCQNKFILIMSDNFDRRVCNGLHQPKIQITVSMTIFTHYTTIDTFFFYYQAMLNLVMSVKRLH